MRESYILVQLSQLSLQMSYRHSNKIMQVFQDITYFLDTIFHSILVNTQTRRAHLHCYNHCNCLHICWHILLRRIRVSKLIAMQKKKTKTWLEYRIFIDMFFLRRFSDVIFPYEYWSYYALLDAFWLKLTCILFNGFNLYFWTLIL